MLFVRVLVSLVISEVALKGWYRVRKASTFFRPAGIDHQSFIAQNSLLGRIRSKCLHGVPLAHRLVQPQLCVSRRMHSFQLMTSHWARNPSDAELEKGPKGPPDSRTRFPQKMKYVNFFRRKRVWESGAQNLVFPLGKNRVAYFFAPSLQCELSGEAAQAQASAMLSMEGRSQVLVARPRSRSRLVRRTQ